MVKLKSLQQTWLKARPDQSSSLKPEELIKFPSGGELAILDGNIFEDKGGHFKVLFTPPITITLKGVEAKWSEGYIYGSHWEGISAAYKAKAASSSLYSPAGSSIILQPTPLFIQCDNKDWNDYGSASSLRYGAVQCGLTSVAMLVATLWPNAKVKQLASETESGQFEDWIAGQFKRLGEASTAMESHVAVLKALGIKSTARRNATISDLKQALHKHPVVCGLSYSQSGHFICASGVADKAGDLPDKWPVGNIDKLVSYPQDISGAGVIINDPYGQRDYSGSGNNWVNIAYEKTDTYGLHNLLTNSDLDRFWVDGGEETGWAVFVDPSTPNAGNQVEQPIAVPNPQAAQPVTKAAGLPSINVTQETWLKTEPIDSSKLSDSQKLKIKPGTLICTVIGSQAGHARVKMPDGSLRYIFNKHFSGQEAECKLSAPVGKTGNFCIDHATLVKAIGAVAADSIPDSEIEMIACALEKYGPDFGVNSKLQVCHLLGQAAHESSGFLFLEEIGDDDYFNSNYDFRDDLGNIYAGDGALFCGRGIIQLTGRNWYKKFSEEMRDPEILSKPSKVGQYPLALGSALFWWKRNKMVEADKGVSESDIITVSRIVNGGDNGRECRIEKTTKVAKILGLL
jgi:putative chitinase